MGQELPQLAAAPLHAQRKDMFESQYLQRVKDTPFIDAQLCCSQPVLFCDPLGPTLKTLLQPRMGTKQLFPLEEVLKLIDSVAGALLQLEQNGREGHGDLGLESVYYSKKEKGFRVINPVFQEESGYLLAKHGKRFTPLSPQQLSALSDDSQQSQTSLKSDIFSLGILLCEVCTLSPSSDIYCPDTYSIFHLEIQKRLETIQEYYGASLAAKIGRCLEYDPDERIPLRELLPLRSESK